MPAKYYQADMRTEDVRKYARLRYPRSNDEAGCAL